MRIKWAFAMVLGVGGCFFLWGDQNCENCENVRVRHLLLNIRRFSWLLFGGGVVNLKGLNLEFVISKTNCDSICLKVRVW